MNDTPDSSGPASDGPHEGSAPSGPDAPGDGAHEPATPGGGDRAAAHPELAEEYRPRFPIFERRRYLNSNSLGALSRRSVELRRRFERDWHELGAAAWYDRWMERLDDVRAGFAATVGGRREEVALMPSVSAALTAVAGALDFGERPRVVVSELDFPTVAYQFLSRRRRGVEVEIVESPDGIRVPLERFAEAVDERTALVATSHVYFTTGAVQDVEALSDLCHERGALLMVDAYQSNGQVPIDAPGWGLDMLVSGALKWLLGGPGLAYLWVRPDLSERLEPTTLSWFGVRDQFEFDPRRPEPREGARRFEMGTPAVGAAFTAAGGLEVVREAGIRRIHRRDRFLASDLAERLRSAGRDLRIAPDPDERSALVLARHPAPADAVEALAAEGIVADARPGCVRFSPHFYNTVADNRAAVDALP